MLRVIESAALLDLALIAVVTMIAWWASFLPPRVLSVRRFYVRGALGLALPGFVLLADAVWHDERVLRHELQHLAQIRRYSPLGVAIFLGWHYGPGTLIARLQSGRWPTFGERWASNPLEREANDAMDRDTPMPPLRGWP